MKLRYLFVLFLLPCFCFSQSEKSNSISKTLYLIPAPQIVEINQGSFDLSKNISIVLSDRNSIDQKFNAEQLKQLLMNEIKTVKVTIGKKGNVFLGIPGEDKYFDLNLKNENIELTPKIDNEGYVLKITSNNVVIAARTTTGLFYGVQTLKQIVRSNREGTSIPCLTISDWPALKLRGWMDDISRGPIPTMDYLKNVIKTMAGYKQNYFTLYTEHTFKLNKYPDISPRDGISAEEIAELTEFAKPYHIEIVGNAQSFGHMEKILSIPFYKKIKENSDVLNPSVEDTYKFLEDMYSEIAPAYKSSLFNINCDETYGLGEGGSKKLVDSIGQDGVYAYHINRINNILKKHGKRIMMWGDIAVNNKGIIEKLPKDLIILSWGYHAAESFDNAILPFKNSGFEFMVAPGVSCWNEVWPDMTNAAINISNYVRDGYKLGAMGMMNTAWDDDGENLFNYNWHGLIWGAECSWKPASAKTGTDAEEERNEKLKSFNSSFDKLFFGCKNMSAVNTLLGFDEIRKQPVKNIVRDGAVWESMLNLFPDNVNEQAITGNKKVLEMAKKLVADLIFLKKDVTQNAFLIDHAVFAAKRVLFTAEKNLVRAGIDSYIKDRSSYNEKEVKSSIANLSAELFDLKKEYVRLWDMENRGWWLDKVLEKYNKLGEQLLNLDKTVLCSTPKTSGDKQFIELSTLFNDRNMYYTINGETPTSHSIKYTQPVELTGPSLIKARVISNNEKYSVTEKYFLTHKAIGRIYKLNSTYSKYNAAYSAGGDNALVDGLTGSDNFADGRWQGYQGQNIDLILDFGIKTDIKRFNISCLQNSYSWVLMPSKVQLYASNDGLSFNLIKTIENSVDPKQEGAIISNFRAEFSNTSMRYLKVICVSQGILPKWHHAAGNESFIFADEIVVE